MKVYFPIRTFESLEEASEEIRLPTGMIYFLSRKKHFPKIYLENQIQIQIDGNNYCNSLQIERKFGVKQKYFFLNLEKDCQFLDEKGVFHRVTWIHPEIQRILEHKGEKRLEILQKNYFFAI